jgi:hypothetical protein
MKFNPIAAIDLERHVIEERPPGERFARITRHSLLFCNYRTRTKEHQSEEVFFDIKLLDTIRQDSPRFVVWPWSC